MSAPEPLTISTPDGDCRAWLFTPSSGDGPWPGAIFYMDGVGIRPNMFAMSQRLADAGYAVLLPDLYFRAGDYAPFDPKVLLASDEARKPMMALLGTTSNVKAAADTEYFLKCLDARPEVKAGPIGTTGYCMGGAISLTVAGTYPDRIGAAASFHGGGLATDAETSPHRFAVKAKGRLYIGEADNDPYYPPEMGERLGKALDEAGVDYKRELYEGSLHGWTQADFPIYDPPAAERHWDALLGLFAATIK